MTQQTVQIQQKQDQRVQVHAVTDGYNLHCGRVCDVQFVHQHHDLIK